MKTILSLIILALTLSTDAAFYQFNRYTTNFDGALINGSTLTNLNGTNIAAGTINSNKLDAPTLALIATGGSGAGSGIATTNGIGTNLTLYSTGPPALTAIGNAASSNTFSGINVVATNYAPIFTLTNAIVLGTRYANGPQRAFIAASFTLNGAAAGTASVTLFVEGNLTNKLTISSGPLASLTVVDTLTAMVGPGETYYFSETSSGAGASVAFVADTFSRKLW